VPPPSLGLRLNIAHPFTSDLAKYQLSTISAN
jgi:hypothetical protein